MRRSGFLADFSMGSYRSRQANIPSGPFSCPTIDSDEYLHITATGVNMKRIASLVVVAAACLLVGLLPTCSGQQVAGDLRSGIAVEEPKRVALNHYSRIELSPQGTRFMIYNDGGNFIAVYDCASGKLLHCYVTGDELTERIHPPRGQPPVRYRYCETPPDKQVYLLPFERGGVGYPHEIESARFISEEDVAIVVNVKGPWRVGEKDAAGAIGMTVVQLLYHIDSGEISRVSMVWGFMMGYVGVTSAIDEGGRRVAVFMMQRKRPKPPRAYRVILHDVEQDNLLELPDGKYGFEHEGKVVLPPVLLGIHGEELLMCTDFLTLQSVPLTDGAAKSVIVDPMIMHKAGIGRYSIRSFRRVREGEYSLLALAGRDDRDIALMYFRFVNRKRVRDIRIADLVDGNIVSIAERPGVDEIFVLYTKSDTFFVKQLSL
jgi:hypothetical protein